MTGLHEQGFTTIGGPFASDELRDVALHYDAIFTTTAASQIKHGSRSTRFPVSVAIKPFDRIYLYPPLLEIASERIGGPFRLSSFFARTLRPQVSAPPLHQDVQRGADGDPLVGFIFMVDAFTPENGATRFVAGSHHHDVPPTNGVEVHGCGPAGSMLIFDGLIWHEHGANSTAAPRRCIQGYFIRRDHTAASHWPDNLNDDQLEQLPADARAILCL